MSRHRLITVDPGTAHPAKNATAPGLPNQSHNHSERFHIVPQNLVDEVASVAVVGHAQRGECA